MKRSLDVHGFSNKRIHFHCKNEERKIQIFVRGNRFSLHHINTSDTVLTLKHMILEGEGYPIAYQILFYGRKILSDEQTLFSYDIREGSTIFLSVSSSTNAEIDKIGCRSKLVRALDTLDVHRIQNILKHYPLLHPLSRKFSRSCELPFHFVCRLPNIKDINFDIICQLFKMLIGYFSIDETDNNATAVPYLPEMDHHYVAGDSCCHIAARTNWCDMINLLVSLNVNVNVKNSKDGNTPLHIALQYGNISAAQTLLNHGANLYILNMESNTPIEIFANKLGFSYSKSIEEEGTVVMDECSFEDFSSQNYPADISILVENQTIHCHKRVLVSRSEYFRLHLTDINSSDNYHRFSIPEISFAEFSTIYSYLYTNQCQITIENIVAILRLAEHFNIPDLRKLCLKFLNHITQTETELLSFFKQIPPSFVYCVPLMEEICFRILKVLLLPKSDLGTERSKAFSKLLEIISNPLLFTKEIIRK